MSLTGPARPVRIPLAGALEAAQAPLLVRGDERPFALCGALAGGGALVSSEPVAVAAPGDDPFALLHRQPELAEGGDAVVGGGWFGYLGYGLGARLERVPPAPRRPLALPDFALAFYDHLLRLDREGQWWFEALWTEERSAQPPRRLDILRARLAAVAHEEATWVGPLAPAAPGATCHVAAVAACRERIAAGEIFQANLCLRLEGAWAGDPLDLFARTTRALAPAYAALTAGPWGALCCASPELFLRRRRRRVVTKPIKGTAPREAGTGEELARSPKDLAGLELNVAIRTLELRGDRLRLGAGGGVVADSDPAGELEECLVKAPPVIAAAGGRLEDSRAWGTRARPVEGLPPALAGSADRPDPALGVFSTLLVREGSPIDLDAHLSRLEASVATLYGQGLPRGLESNVRAAVAGWSLARLRAVEHPGRAAQAEIALEAVPLDREPRAEPVALRPVLPPGGLGEHKWRDRRLLDELARRLGAVPLIVDLDGYVLEAGFANVWIVEGDTLVTPPLDGRLLGGTVRARLVGAPPPGLEVREQPVSLARVQAADEILISSAVRGIRPAALGHGEARFELGARVRALMLEPTAEAVPS